MSAAKGKLNGPNLFGSLYSHADTLFLVTCVLLAFLVRLFFLPNESVINGDGAYYTILGERFASGDFADGISAYWSPLYSVLTGLSSLLFTDREFAGRFVSLLAGALLIIPAYYLIREFFGKPAACVGSVILVLHPFLIRTSGWVMTESVYTLILTTVVLSGWFALSRKDWRLFLLTGSLMGAAFLTKPEAIGYVALMLGLAALVLYFGKNGGFRATAQCSLVFLIGFAVFFVPYCLHLHQKTGNWTLSQKIAVNLPAADYHGELLAIMSDGRMTMKDRLWGDDYETASAVESVKPAPIHSLADASDSRGWADAAYILGSNAWVQLKKQLREYFPAILPIPFAIFAIAGFFLGRWTLTRAAKEIYLLLFVTSTLLGYAASSVELRYLFPLIPLLMAWASSGIVKSSEWLASIIRPRFQILEKVRPGLLAALLVVILSVMAAPYFSSILKEDTITNVPFEEKDAGLWIKRHAEGSQPTVMSSHITPAFYANAKHIYLPDEKLSTVLNYAKIRRTSYLVLSTRRKLDGAYLADMPNSHPGVNLVYHDRERPGYEVRVYQFSY